MKISIFSVGSEIQTYKISQFYQVTASVHTSSQEAKYTRLVSPGNLVSRLDNRRNNSSANPTQV
jgi:hypothetical protein